MQEKDGRGGGRERAQDYYSSLTLRGAVSCGSDVVRAAASYIISYLQVRQGQSGQTRVVEAVASPRVHQLHLLSWPPGPIPCCDNSEWGLP